MNNKILYFKNSLVGNLLLLGLVWLGVGILNFFEENILCQILSILLFLIGLLGSLLLATYGTEKVDEMSRYHLTKAFSSSFIYVIGFITLLTFITFIGNLFHFTVDFKFSTVSPFIFAIGLLGICYKYIHLERHGE